MKTYLLALLMVWGIAVPGGAQKLEDAATQERARRAQIKSLGQVYTNEDLKKYHAEGEPSSSVTPVSIQSATGRSVPLQTQTLGFNSKDERL